jgi:diphthine synthase
MSCLDLCLISRPFRRSSTHRSLIFHVKQEEYYGKEVTIADREMVESQVDAILENADRENVAFLVVGDPFG